MQNIARWFLQFVVKIQAWPELYRTKTWNIPPENQISTESDIFRETQLLQVYRYAKISQLFETVQFCRYVGNSALRGGTENEGRPPGAGLQEQASKYRFT